MFLCNKQLPVSIESLYLNDCYDRFFTLTGSLFFFILQNDLSDYLLFSVQHSDLEFYKHQPMRIHKII